MEEPEDDTGEGTSRVFAALEAEPSIAVAGSIDGRTLNEDSKDIKVPILPARLSESERQTRLIGGMLFDALVEPARSRLRRLDTDVDYAASDEIVEMADMYVAVGGGSLRTFNGGLNHECGWWPSKKRRRLQHWEGMAQRSYLQLQEVANGTLWAQSEARHFTFPLNGRRRGYTCDVELRLADGRIVIVEVKRSAEDLSDPDYRLKLAVVAEICRRVGMEFRIVFADEMFASRHHRHNVELFSSRRFAAVTPLTSRRLHDFKVRRGAETTYGDLAETLRPDWPVAGMAAIQALVVRRRIEIDLTGMITADTPLTII